jgi:hypothetical protein
MEALLSLAFDNIASKDTQKIRKGLRQIEGMLAQICLSGSKSKASTPGHRRNASAINLGEQQESTPKKLGQLSEDPAFREFFRLQEGFEWNGKGAQLPLLGAILTHILVATRVADCLERLLGMGSSKGKKDRLLGLDLSNATRRWPKRHPYPFITLEPAGPPTSSLAITNHFRSRSLYESPARPPRSLQLPCDPIASPPCSRDSTPRDTTKHTYIRTHGRTVDRYELV